MRRILAIMMTLALLPCGMTAFAQEGESPDGLHASIQPVTDSPQWVAELPEAQDADQLFVVAGLGMDKTTATVSMHQRDEEGSWKQILSTPGYVGKNGLCMDEDHVEGCGQTPVGVYHFNKAFGIAPDPGCALEYIQVDDNTYWSGDPDRNYNEMVDIRDCPDLVMDDSEHIVDYEYQYQYCLNISFNEDGTPGRGSAIFLHCLGPVKPYTGGCVAIPENIMKLVMQNVREDCVVVIGTLDTIAPSVWEEWGLAPAPESADAEEAQESTDAQPQDGAQETSYGASAVYDEADMESAVSQITAEFNTWGCTLLDIRYAGDECCSEENLNWLRSLDSEKNYTQCIEFLMDFHSPTEENLGGTAWNPDSDYTDYQWWLARPEGGEWEVMSWGY